MIAHARLWRLLALAAALLATATLLVAPPPPSAAQPTAPPSVYILRGGDATSDAAVARALTDAGLDVTTGVATPDYDGTQANLADYDAVVMLYNANWATPLLTDGLNAIERYVDKGGALISGEWVVWRSQLAPIMPAEHCGWNSVSATTYMRVAPNPAINADVPDSFSVSLNNFSGSESCLRPRAEATVLYASSNAGGRGDGAGLVAWNVGRGRVASFSTLLSAVELQSPAYRTLVQNTVRWLATTRDSTPPKIKSISVSNGGLLSPTREVMLSFTASDAGGSGLGAYYIVERVFSGNPDDAWANVRTSTAWEPYEQPGASLTWTLSETPGVHYLQVYVADRAGNVSREPGVVFVNYRPAQVSLGLDELHIYRIAPGDGTPTMVRMDDLGGDPDLYVFGPGVSFIAENDDPSAEATFTAQAGVYQVEVEGFTAGSYSLQLNTGTPARASQPDDTATLTRRPRISVTALNPPEPEANPEELPAAPVDPAPAALGDALFLPILRR